jgi:AraC family transcriptional regulator of arabinose operon
MALAALEPPGAAAAGLPSGHVRVFRDQGCLISMSHVRVHVERYAACVCFALGDGPLRLRHAGGVLDCGIVALRPYFEGEFDSSGEAFACIDVLPTHEAYRAFGLIDGAGVLALPRAGHDALIAQLREFHRGDMAAADAYRLFRRGVNLATSRLPEAPPADPRVTRALWRLHAAPGLPLEALARELGLSLDRLSHLFALDMGFPLRRYVQAAKVVAAGRYFGSGKSLTEIAVAAGFTDLAHFSRVWRRSYGMPPAFYFRSGAVRAWSSHGPPKVLWQPPALACA